MASANARQTIPANAHRFLRKVQTPTRQKPTTNPAALPLVIINWLFATRAPAAMPERTGAYSAPRSHIRNAPTRTAAKLAIIQSRRAVLRGKTANGIVNGNAVGK